MGGIRDLFDSAWADLRADPVDLLFPALLVALSMFSLFQAARLVRLIAYADFREEVALRLADRDDAHRLPRVYQFRLKGVLPADRIGDWQRLEDLSHWMRNQAVKQFFGHLLTIPITGAMLFYASTYEPPLDSRDDGRDEVWRAVTATVHARSACTFDEIKRFVELRDDPARDARTPISFVCASTGYTLSDR